MELTIGKLARAAGVGIETIRYYERRGLLKQPPRPTDGYRLYPAEAVRRVRFIKRAQGLGFSLREISALLRVGEGASLTTAEVLAVAKAKVADIDAKLRALQEMRRTLLDLIENCPGAGALAGCPIWSRLESNSEERRREDVQEEG